MQLSIIQISKKIKKEENKQGMIPENLLSLKARVDGDSRPRSSESHKHL